MNVCPVCHNDWCICRRREDELPYELIRLHEESRPKKGEKILKIVIKRCEECPYYYFLTEQGQVFHGCRNTVPTNGIRHYRELSNKPYPPDEIPSWCPIP